MRGEIVRIQRDLGTTTIYVTHDQVEAMTMGTRVAVMDRGTLRQVDTPERLYEAPADVFVARFMGSPPMSLLVGRLAVAGGRVICHLGEASVELPEAVVAARPDLHDYADRDVIVGVRSEGFSIAPAGSVGALPGRIHLVEMLGSESLAHVEVGVPAYEGGRDGQLSGRFPGRLGVSAGDAVGVEIDPTRIELFDPETGKALRRVWR